MNRKIASLALVAAAALSGQAFAETPTVVNEKFVSTKTRAEVQAELAAYKQTGVNTYSISYNPLKTFRSSVTRDQVTAQFLADRDDVAAVTGEDSGSFAQARHSVPVSGTKLAAQ
jgi:hypothetical protein